MIDRKKSGCQIKRQRKVRKNKKFYFNANNKRIK